MDYSMNYTIDISRHSAELIFQEPGEPDAEFEERKELVKGKSFISLRVLDKRDGTHGKQFTMQSPLFVADDSEMQNEVIKSTFEGVRDAVLANEKIKLTEPPPKEKSALVLPPGFGG